ncbi:MAG: ABC transporter substrate-binding protein [Kastovskya adunca ATA6-11-RM4]|jgi:NitT/TauT family transport system substrate-binding protein|nr:ABC transporter substrate-binding protein [Kastovskya adunca ATA6-11-RM4]
MKPRLLRFLLLFLFAIVLATACNSRTTVTSSPELPPLRVSYNLWPGVFPLVLAQEKGFFVDQGVNVKAVYSNNYLEPASDFTANKYDGVFLALGSVMNIIEKNPNAQIVLVTDDSAGADAVVAQRGIQSVAELKGKRIGIKRNDFGELFVTRMLEDNGISVNDVTLVNLEAKAVPERLKSGDIQAGHTWEPYLFKAVEFGAKKIFSSKQTPGLISDVMIFHGDVLRDRPNDVKAFIRAWFQAQDYWQAHPAESNALIAKKLNITPEEVSPDGIHLANLPDNLKAFTPGETTQSLYYTAKLYVDFYTRKGVLSAAPDVQKLINPSFVQQLEEVN